MWAYTVATYAQPYILMEQPIETIVVWTLSWHLSDSNTTVCVTHHHCNPKANIKEKIPEEYGDFLELFIKAITTGLPPHRPYDSYISSQALLHHKIKCIHTERLRRLIFHGKQGERTKAIDYYEHYCFTIDLPFTTCPLSIKAFTLNSKFHQTVLKMRS